MGRPALVACVVVIAALGCRERAAPAPAPAPTEVEVEPAHVAAWREDLDVLARELPARHKDAFFALPAAEFHAGVDALRAELAGLTEAQIVVRVQQLVVKIGDGHTRAYAPGAAGYPIGLAWFDDGLVVTGAAPSEAWAIGQPVTAIGGRPVADALALAATVAPHDNGSQLRAETIGALVRAPTVVGLGLADASGAMTLTLATPTGPRPLTVAVGGPRAVGAVVDPAALPLARRGRGRIYWHERLAAERALFVQYNQCVDGTPSFAEFTAAVAAALAPGDRLIIDLRANGGGNSEVARPLLALVARDRALAARTFVLIGRGTFSSAVLNALALADAGATLVGETAGGAPSHYGEVKSFELPRSKLAVTYSTKYFPHPRHPGRELVPAIVVPVTAADFFANVDAALAAALAAPVPAAAR